MRRAFLAFITASVGVALGLAYGWVANPVTFRDTTASALRADFRADYVLMVAETFHAQQNVELARRQLAIFGDQSPGQVCAQALMDARAAGFAASDLALLDSLSRQMNAASPSASPPVRQP